MTTRLFQRIVTLMHRACPFAQSLHGQIPGILFAGVLMALLLCLTVSGSASAITAPLAPGLNLTGVTADLVAGQPTAFPLLAAWKTAGVNAVEAYDAGSGTMLRAELDGGGNPSGVDFPLVENRALYVYATQLTTLSLGDNAPCAPLDLSAGFNLASYACFPAAYRASDFLASVGLANITSLSRLDTPTGRWQTAAVDAGSIVGEDFPLVAGEGYIIHASAISGWNSPLGLNPVTLAVQQGQPGVSLTVSIPFAAPDGGTVIDLVSSDSTLVAVAAQVTVPGGSSSVAVLLTMPDTGITTAQAVTVTASRAGMTGAQASLSVRPKPTIDLSPLTTVTGLTFSYQLTVSLSDIAPSGGFPVTLTAVPDGIVTVPATVTIPAGASSAQVAVTALSTIGSATIIATSPGRGFSGAQHGVTVKATQAATYTPLVSRQLGVQVAVATPPPPTTTYTPLTSAQVGVQVALPPPSPTVNSTYTPITSAPVGVNVTVVPPVNQTVGYGPLMTPPVGVTVGSTITSVTPVSGAIGATGIKVRALGVGLNSASAISFNPATGITIQPGSFAIGVDGNPEVTIDIAADAPVTPRTVLVALSTGGYALPTDANSNQFRVTLPTPEIYNVQPLRATVGQSVTMTIIGKNLTSASSVNFVHSGGITVNNPPTVTGGGTGITTTFTIAANAEVSTRAVTVTTPGGTSSPTADHTNSFTITAANDPGVVHTAFTNGVGVLVETTPPSPNQVVNYGPITGLPLGVVVETPPPPTNQNVIYGPTVSQSLGVTVGSTITRITPPSGNIASSLTVRAEGVGLDTATAISFQPATGITVDSFAIVDGNPEAAITIAADAPVTPRTVLVALSGGGYALPTLVGSNQFRVTLPQPEIFSLQPIRAMVGQGVAMTILGKDFGGASSVNFTPPNGITVINPPTVSPDGKMITVNFTIAVDAKTESRVVTVTTPGGGTSGIATTANTFSVTPDMGVTYTPLLSAELGVMVTVPPPPTNQGIDYGPLNSAEVGVMVTVPPPPTNQEVTYGPLVATLGVAVGGHFTGFSPIALEPGSSASFTLTGVGLDAVTSISVVPAANMTVTDWTPALDGLSGTVTIAADSGAVSGIRSLVPLVGSTALPPVAPGAALLRVGYKPIANAITTTYPTSTVLATVGTTVTLTMYGVNLQGVTKVEVFPPDDITIDTVPVWYSDNEHVSVTVIIAADAATGPRLVRLTTPYGSTSAVLGVTNTLTIVSLVGTNAPVSESTDRLAAKKAPAFVGSDSLQVITTTEFYGLSGHKLDAALLPSLRPINLKFIAQPFNGIVKALVTAAIEQVDASRGPPVG